MRASVVLMVILALSAVAFTTISAVFNLRLSGPSSQTSVLHFGAHLSEAWANGDPIGGGGGGPGAPPR